MADSSIKQVLGLQVNGGLGGGSASEISEIPATAIPEAWLHPNFGGSQYQVGWNKDGDYISFSNTSIRYYNSAGAQVWAKNGVSGLGSGYSLVGAVFNPNDNLLYVCGRNGSFLNVATFNQAGTRTYLLTNYTYTDVASNMGVPYGVTPSSLNCSDFSTGSWFINNHDETLEFDLGWNYITTHLRNPAGSTVPSSAYKYSSDNVPYITKDRLAIKGFCYINSYVSSTHIPSKSRHVTIWDLESRIGINVALPKDFFLHIGGDYLNLDGLHLSPWGDYVTMITAVGGTVVVPAMWERETFDAWVKETYERALGVQAS